MTTDDMTARLAEIQHNILYRPQKHYISNDDLVFLLTALTDALERERVLIENRARLCDAIRAVLTVGAPCEHTLDEAIRDATEARNHLSEVLSEIEGKS